GLLRGAEEDRPRRRRGAGAPARRRRRRLERGRAAPGGDRGRPARGRLRLQPGERPRRGGAPRSQPLLTALRDLALPSDERVHLVLVALARPCAPRFYRGIPVAAAVAGALVAVLAPAPVAAAPFDKGPYLQNVSATSVTVLWESSPPRPGVVRLLG